jgi:hypothetical protein
MSNRVPLRVATRLPLVAALTGALLVGGCANPWEFFPHSALYRTAQQRMSRPAPRVWANYCGLGTKHGDLSRPPLNDLDRACLAHDICYIEARAGCGCDTALSVAAGRIAADPSQPDTVRNKAREVRAAFSLGFCHVFPRGVLPPRDPHLLKTLPAGAFGIIEPARGIVLPQPKHGRRRNPKRVRRRGAICRRAVAPAHPMRHETSRLDG